MFKKAIFLFFIMFFSLLYPLNSITHVYAQSSSQISETTYSSDIISVNSSNVTKIIQKSMFLGYIYGGFTIYVLRAGIYVNTDLSLNFLFTRDSESILLNFNRLTPDFNGTISFTGCCSNVLKPLTLSISFLNNILPPANISYILLMSYTITTISHRQSLASEYKITSVNILGYPYPPRAFIIGLMVLLLGTLPTFIIDRILLKFLRR